MSLIKTSDLPMRTILALVDEAENPTPPRGDGWVASAFFEPSTRTKLSFHAAARDAGYKVLDLPPSEASSITKGESERDTIANMLAICEADTVILRSKDETLITEVSEAYPEVLFLNAGNGKAYHPTQALGDLLTLKEHYQSWKKISDLRVTIMGDVAFSRVARSNIELLLRFGVKVAVAGPKGWICDVARDYEDVVAYETLPEALDNSDVVMALRIQHERRKKPDVTYSKSFSERNLEDWTITKTHLMARPDLRIMHPGPVNRGVELTSEAVDGPQSLILRQARNGYRIRRALLQVGERGKL